MCSPFTPRDCRKTVSTLKVRRMELPKEKVIDASDQGQGRVWVSGNLSSQNLNNTQKRDRHCLPSLSHKEMGEGTESLAFVI